MKKIVILGLLMAGSTAGVPKVAASLGYENVSIQDSLQTLQAALEAVTKAFEH